MGKCFIVYHTDEKNRIHVTTEYDYEKRNLKLMGLQKQF